MSYIKLAKILSIQQDQLEKQITTIKISEELLIDEMEKNQTMTNEHSALKEKFDELSTRHDLLSADYEKLTYEFLQRKIAHEKLKEAHEELENVNLTLMVQHKNSDKTESVIPCSTCLKRDKIMSSAESFKGKEPIVIDVEANPLDEEKSFVTEELLGLKELFETGMF